MNKNLFLGAILALSLVACTGKKDKVSQEVDLSNKLHLLVGTYTSGDSKSDGIYVYQFDTETGDVLMEDSVKVANPSYLAITKNEKFVYAVSENENDTDAANAFSFDNKTGKIELLNSQLTKGEAPCYISVDSKGENVITANYTGGSITVFKTEKDGKLKPEEKVIKFSGSSVNKQRQNKPHLHCVAYSPDEKYLFANDLGADKIYKFEVASPNSKNYLTLSKPAEFNVSAGSGPRHIVFHPIRTYAYLITEISGDVVAFHYNKGNLEQFQTVKVDSIGAQGGGDIQITPNGNYLYASNRLEGDGLAIFSINQDTGILTKVGYQDTGIHPRNFVITPNGKFVLVACRDTNTIEIYEIDNNTGLLTNINKNINVGKPVCLKFASYD